ncbi:MAG: hypothetical protein DMF63_10190 [Acidobacteria bacterium]|nr:MAG: hypothetical protein DMF63_10190 [Acidobacteriota bacterium]
MHKRSRYGPTAAGWKIPDRRKHVRDCFGSSEKSVVRLRSNGTLDPKFVSGLGPQGSAAALRFIIPHNGKYILGGTFDTFNTSARTSIVSISNTTKAPVDFDGDGKTDWAIARHYGGEGPWTYWINLSSDGSIVTFNFGTFTADALQPGDYDGDGMTDIAHWRGVQSLGGAPVGYWIQLSSTDTVKFIPFGQGGDAPVGAEDYDGDGKDDMATWRIPGPGAGVGQGTWFYRGSFNNPNGNITYIPFGMRYGDQADQADRPVIGDFDGDGKADFRIRRRADMTVATSNTQAIWYTLTASGTWSVDYFGWNADRSLAGDYDGDGKTDMAIARNFNIGVIPATWYIRSTSGSADKQFNWGLGGVDQVAQGDYDGDGITDPTVYRRGGENNYYVLRSTDNSMQVFHWGKDDVDCGPACDIAVATYNSR